MLKKVTLILIIILTTTACCKKEEEKQKDPIDKLPPPTHVGANTAGCLVNGEAFLPGNHPMPLKCEYYQQYYFGLGILHRVNNKTHSIIIEVAANLQEGQTYRLTVEDYLTGQDGNWAAYKEDSDPPPNPNHYATNNTYYGELTITHHDYINAILSGTFWFDGINNQGEVVHVTDGRFDCKY